MNIVVSCNFPGFFGSVDRSNLQSINGPRWTACLTKACDKKGNNTYGHRLIQQGLPRGVSSV